MSFFVIGLQQKKPGFFKRLSSSSLPKIKPLTESERIGRVAMRARTLKFVDSRDEVRHRPKSPFVFASN